MGGFPSFDGHWLVVLRPREYEYEVVGVYDSEVKARNVARMRFNDTGLMPDVYRLAV